jgi:HEAT repeat protein
MSSLAEFVEKLNCNDEVERAYAAEDIGYLNESDGVPALLQQLGAESSRAVRDTIFQALIRIDADAAIEGSILLFGSEDPQMRNQAVDVLRHKGARSIPFLNTVMRNGDKDMRKLVLDVLSGMRELVGSDAAEIYAAALTDQDVNVVITAVENLGRLRAGEFCKPIEDLLVSGTHPMLVGACLEALVGIGHESSLEAIRRRFPDLAATPDFLLSSCLKALAALGSAKEFAEVASLLPVRGPHLHSAILGALIDIYPRCPSPDLTGNLLPLLLELIEDKDTALCRYRAVRVLGFSAARDDVYAFLVSCLSSTERLVRLGAAEALRTADRPEVESLLAARALEESDEEVLQALSC